MWCCFAVVVLWCCFAVVALFCCCCAVAVTHVTLGICLKLSILFLKINKTVMMKLKLIILEAANPCRFWKYIYIYICISVLFVRANHSCAHL